MTDYQNLSGSSGVSAFEIGDDFIKVQFQDGGVYMYNYSSTGEGCIETMKELAKEGEGLNTFINQNVKKKYAYKLSSGRARRERRSTYYPPRFR